MELYLGTYDCLKHIQMFPSFKSLWYNHLQEKIIIRHYYCISLIFHMALNEYFRLSFREIHFYLLHPPPICLFMGFLISSAEWIIFMGFKCNSILSQLYMGTCFSSYIPIYPFSKASCYKTEAKLTFKYKIQFGFWPLELADSSCKIDGTSA